MASCPKTGSQDISKQLSQWNKRPQTHERQIASSNTRVLFPCEQVQMFSGLCLPLGVGSAGLLSLSSDDTSSQAHLLPRMQLT